MQSAEVFYLKQKEEECRKELVANSENKRKIITKWAEIVEQLHESGEYKEPIFTIARYLNAEIEKLNVDISSAYLYEVLDDRFKNSPSPGLSTTGQPEGKAIQELDNSELVDVFKEVKDEISELDGMISKKKAKKDRYELIVNELSARKLQVPELKTKDSARKPDPHESESWKAMDKLINRLEDVRQKLYEYPPAQDHDKGLAEAISTFTDLWGGMNDDKYAKCAIDWFKVTEDNYTKSHRAAAKHNPSAFTLPDGTEHIRKLTHEQIIDKAEEYTQLAYQTAIHIPLFAEFVRWYREIREPVMAERRFIKGPKLSNLS